MWTWGTVGFIPRLGFPALRLEQLVAVTKAT